MDLLGTRSKVAPDPGMIWVRTGVFTAAHGMGSFREEVRIGPFESVTVADTVLKEALLAGFAGARLVVE